MATPVGLPKVEGYIIAEKIGSGSYADVYKAYKKGTTREVVAIKCVSLTNLSKFALDNLITEIGILKKLKHEHIVEMKDFVWDDTCIYIIMEYCKGGDLSTFVKSKRRLPETVCKRFLQQLAAALKYLRSQNVSHLDLKPSNILLSSKSCPVLKIADFGLAQHMPEDDTISALKGSPLYMAPEILLKRQYDAKVDLWSVGVILYECLFGKAPYSSNSMDELIKKIQTAKPIEVPYGTNISAECRDLLHQCLEREVSKRIDFEDFFNHPFVDLEHKPGPDSITKATELLTTAVNLDECQEYEEAFRTYSHALQYLVPVLHIERDAVKRGALRTKVTSYLNRTEELKKMMDCEKDDIKNIRVPSLGRQESIQATSYQGNREELIKLSRSTPQIIETMEIAVAGDMYAREGSYAIAQEKYELALGKLLALLQKEPKGRRQNLLKEEVMKWMSNAEKVKELQAGDSSDGNTLQKEPKGKRQNPLKEELKKRLSNPEKVKELKTGDSSDGNTCLDEDNPEEVEKSCLLQ